MSFHPWGALGTIPLPQPITLQGLTVRPGDPVIQVTAYDGQTPRIFLGVCPSTGGAILEINQAAQSTADTNAPGPWPLDCLRHPDWLAGFAKEIDAE